jgi:hypothetical protein
MAGRQVSAAAGWIRLALRGSEDALRDGALPPSAQHEAAALVVLVSRTLVSRRFATPRDRRIEPFARSLVAVPSLAGLFTADEVEGAVRAMLGDVDQLGKLQPDRIVALNLLLARALLAEAPNSSGQVDQLIAYAESQLRSLPDPREPRPVGRPRRRRIPALVGRFVLAGVAIALVAGYVVAGFVTPGFLVADSSASQRPSLPSDVEEYVTDLAQSIETRDGVAFQALLCSTAEPVESYIQELGAVDGVVVDTVTGEDDNYTVLFEITSDGGTVPAGWLGHLHREEDQWCLSNLSELG